MECGAASIITKLSNSNSLPASPVSWPRRRRIAIPQDRPHGDGGNLRPDRARARLTNRPPSGSIILPRRRAARLSCSARADQCSLVLSRSRAQSRSSACRPKNPRPRRQIVRPPSESMGKGIGRPETTTWYKRTGSARSEPMPAQIARCTSGGSSHRSLRDGFLNRIGSCPAAAMRGMVHHWPK
jgi:hypothetical protein